MRVERIKDFISEEERQKLNAWVRLGVQNRWLDHGLSRRQSGYQKRLTSRMYGDRFEYPAVARNIASRILDLLGLDESSIIVGHGKNGIVVSCTFDGGDVYEHRDPRRESDGMATLRCNILTQAAEQGGKLYLDGTETDVGECELHCYLASEHLHFVSEVKGQTPRILWMFGAHVPAEDWDTGKIQINEMIFAGA